MPRKTEEFDVIVCNAQMTSISMRGHKHTCIGNHNFGEDHYCGDCQRWWGRGTR